MTEKVFRVQLYSKNYEKLNNFYKNQLGFPIVGGRETGHDDRVTLYKAASGVIETIYAPPDSEVPESMGLTIQIEVDNVDAFFEQIRLKEVPIIRGIENKFWGHRNFKIRDPNGIEITVYSPID
jgi:uncharacterized glyoxalase superfamily protein PhnB